MTNTRARKEKPDNNLGIYLKEINRVPMLSREEEKELARETAAGNKAAREKLVNANLRFVVNVAKRYQGMGLPLEDLISEGNAGLINAVDRFNTDKGCHFISYAVWWIRQAITSALCQKARMIRLPTNRAAQLIKIENARRFIKKQCRSEGEIGEIAELLDMDENHITDLINISRKMLSLDNPVSEGKTLLLREYIEDNRYNSPDKYAEQKLLKVDIEDALDTLKEYEADIIRCHFGLGRNAMTLEEIGDKYNLSKERIRQIEAKALSRLKHPTRVKKLQAYVA
jgi:RNA polymerase primary sigma factor